jgi:uncharacterized repeat protein (TIGR03803 family)
MKSNDSRFAELFLLVLLSFLFVAPATGQTVSTLYNFSGQNSSGSPAGVVLAQGHDGKLYGTTYGPSGSAGSIFRVTTSGVETQLYTFGSDGTNPTGGLTLATDGNFYGTASAGGASNNGVLFMLSPNSVYTVLHEFAGGTDGAIPDTPPIEASDGNLYGTTLGIGGASTVYKFTIGGSLSTIYTFSQTSGEYAGALVQGTDGNLYGTAELGGTGTCGTLFKLTTAGSLLWSYSFPCGLGGFLPFSLLQANDGNFYGTTLGGGVGIGCGTVFKLNQQDHVSLLYAFKNVPDGCEPFGLVQGTDGNLYGTTFDGGKGSSGGNGTVFQLTVSGTHTILYDFGANGKSITAAPMQDTNGNFYGTTESGGKFNNGTVYRLNMGLGPFITFVQPTGIVGQTAQILGQGLTGATGVTFNGVPATSFKVGTDTFMTAVVPTGANTGKVAVTTPGGTLTSNVSFRVIQ